METQKEHMEPQEKYHVRRRLRGEYTAPNGLGRQLMGRTARDGRFGGKGCEVWVTKRRARGGASGGEGERGQVRKGKNGGAMYLVKSKDLHLSGGKKSTNWCFFCSSAWKM